MHTMRWSVPTCCAFMLLTACPFSWSTDIEDIADISNLASEDPAIKIRVQGNEIGGGMFMGEPPVPMNGQSPVAAQAFTTAKSLRTSQATSGIRIENDETDKKDQLGEASTSPLKYTYEDVQWEKWAMCSQGTKQSPIDLVRPYYGAFLKLKGKYVDQEWPTQENDGLVLKVPFKNTGVFGQGAGVLQIGDKEYQPVEAVIRAPSEHKLNGIGFDMEMQITHEDTIGNKIVMAILMQVSDQIPSDNFYISNVFGHFFQDLPEFGAKRRVESLNLKWILNEKMMEHYVQYHGSLSHPPCTEGVEWFVLGRPWLVEKKWVENYKSVIPSSNARDRKSVV